MHELEALLGHQAVGLGLGVAVGLTVQHDLRPAGTNGVDLERRRGDRHDDHRTAAEFGCGEGNPLRVVASRGADDSTGTLLRAELGHFVVGTAHLEREDRLEVLALEQHLITGARRKRRGIVKGRFDCDVVDVGGQDASQIVVVIDTGHSISQPANPGLRVRPSSRSSTRRTYRRRPAARGSQPRRAIRRPSPRPRG